MGINNNNGGGSSNDRLISNLPLRVFARLISGPRSISNPTDAASLRERILSKLSASHATDYLGRGGGGGGGAAVLTIRDVLSIPSPILLRILDPCLTQSECDRLISRIHRECAAASRSALELARRRTRDASHGGDDRSTANDDVVVGRIPTGLPTLDSCLRGGIPVGSIVEVVGRAGTGKTHMAQQLTVSAAASGGGVIYIDAERKMNLHRLREIALEGGMTTIPPSYSSDASDRVLGGDLANLVLENATIHRPLTTRELLDALDKLEGEILLRNSVAVRAVGRGRDCERGASDADAASPSRRLPVRLIVLDSIAAPLRRDYEMGASAHAASRRASAIFRIAKVLKRLAHDHDLAVVVVNQVGSGVGSGMPYPSGVVGKRRNRTLDINDGEYTASLGTAWQYCATTRIVLEHYEDDPHELHRGDLPGDDGGSIRVAKLTKSLVSRRTKIPFELTRQGLREVSPR